MKVYPVIHYLDHEIALQEAKLAKDCGADGVFFISHLGADKDVLYTAWKTKQELGDFQIGINLLSRASTEAAKSAKDLSLDMVWADQMGVSSQGLNSIGKSMELFAFENPRIKLFASVAFKYQAVEPDPVEATKIAFQAGFIPTTSGNRTGHAPSIEKIRDMHDATGVLGIASGMTPDNIHEYAPFLSHVLVATGIAKDEFRMDANKLMYLIMRGNPHV